MIPNNYVLSPEYTSVEHVLIISIFPLADIRLISYYLT
jgi:hypothetical protein